MKNREEFMTHVEMVEASLRDPIFACIEMYGWDAVRHSLKWWLEVINQQGPIEHESTLSGFCSPTFEDP